MVEEEKNRWAQNPPPAGSDSPYGLTGPKSDFWAHRFYLSIHSRHAVYNSSEIDKIRYCLPSR